MYYRSIVAFVCTFSGTQWTGESDTARTRHENAMASCSSAKPYGGRCRIPFSIKENQIGQYAALTTRCTDHLTKLRTMSESESCEWVSLASAARCANDQTQRMPIGMPLCQCRCRQKGRTIMDLDFCVRALMR